MKKKPKRGKRKRRSLEQRIIRPGHKELSPGFHLLGSIITSSQENVAAFAVLLLLLLLIMFRACFPRDLVVGD